MCLKMLMMLAMLAGCSTSGGSFKAGTCLACACLACAGVEVTTKEAEILEQGKDNNGDL